MGGCRCSYKHCTNTTKTRENLHFFHYPVKQKDRCRVWIENANKPQFYNLDEDQLRNKVICETHFEDSYFPNEQKKRLLQGAVPTLDGDCEPKVQNNRMIKLQDVQVLPANADGTIFVLETQNNFHSEKVESYIYTNNGLVLPIKKSEPETTSLNSTLSMYSGASELSSAADEGLDSKDYIINDASGSEVTDDLQKHRSKLVRNLMEHNDAKMKKDSSYFDNKYVKKINQHSKDIAILKRLFKSRKTLNQRPTTASSLHVLKARIPPSLFGVLNLQFNASSGSLSQEDLDFFTTIFSTAPQLYPILSQKYNWKLPSADALGLRITNKNNGHV